MTPFTYVCLHVLLDHHGTGIASAHPNYIRESLDRFSLPDFTDEDAWCALDYINHRRVLEWCKGWGITPDTRFVKNYEDEMDALGSLRAQGLDF